MMCTKLNTKNILCLLLLIAMVGCKSGLTEEQKVYLDFAKLEDRYANAGIYNNLYLSDYVIPNKSFEDKNFSAKKWAQDVKDRLQLSVAGDGEVVISGMGEESIDNYFPYPSVLHFNKVNDSMVQVSADVWVPASFHQFSFDSTDVGKVINQDSMQITLLDVTNNVATLLVVDETEKRDFHYTYDAFERSQKELEEAATDATLPGYKYLFSSERFQESNVNKWWRNDSTLHIDNSRLSWQAVNAQNDRLLTNIKSEDFRHYLWYRSHDMPYKEMESDYQGLKFQYKEDNKDSNHHFSVKYIVTLSVVGKYKKVEGVIRSKQGKVEKVSIGNLPIKKTSDEQSFSFNLFYPAFPVIDTSNVAGFFRTGSYAINHKDNTKEVCLYFSTPVTPNILFQRSMDRIGSNDQVLNKNIHAVYAVTDKKDTIEIKNFDDAPNSIIPGNMDRIPGLRAILVPKPGGKIVQYLCELELEYYPATVTKYTAANVPQGFTIAGNGSILQAPHYELMNLNKPVVYGIYPATATILSGSGMYIADSTGYRLTYQIPAAIKDVELIQFAKEARTATIWLSIPFAENK